jgi:hypothetical protein
MRDNRKGAEIFCPICGQETLALRRPVFEGLKKVGEKLCCSACGTEFDQGEVEFVEKEKVEVFTDEDGVRLCMYCAHYIVNPFTQRCTLRMKEVEATDTCRNFVRRLEKKEEEEPEKDDSELKKLFGENQGKDTPGKPRPNSAPEREERMSEGGKTP